MTFHQFIHGQEVQFYTAGGWKNGTIHSTSPESCVVAWSSGSAHKLTRIYDERNLRNRGEKTRR